jgi:hypothetical protein
MAVADEGEPALAGEKNLKRQGISSESFSFSISRHSWLPARFLLHFKAL